MMWTSENDVLLCREILVEEPFCFKIGTRERGQCWDRIASSLNTLGSPRFWVDQRAVRDRYLKLERGFKRRKAEEERASGITPPEPTELDMAIRDIIERGEEVQHEVARGEESAIEKERETAESVRKRSMERLAETRARESHESGKKRRRNDGGKEVLEYFRVKNEKELNLKREEIELKKRELEMKEKEKEREWDIKKRELEMKEKEWEARAKSDNEMITMMLHHLQEQQELQKQMREQNKLMLDLMKNLLDKFM